MNTCVVEMNADSMDSVKRARRALLLLFFEAGATGSVWAVHIPSIRRQLELDEWTLGLVLSAAPIGLVVGLGFAGRLVDRFGGAAICRATITVFILLLVAPGFATSPQILAASLFVGFGLVGGVAEVALNASAVRVERAYGRPLMSSFHAAYSLGGISGALAGGGLASAGVTPAVTFCVVAAPMAPVSAVAARRLLPESGAAPVRTEGISTSRRTGSRMFLMLGVLALLCQLGEGAARDWCGVYLQDATDASDTLTSAGFVAFSVAMTVGRLFGDRLASLMGPVWLIRCSAITATFGLGLGLLGSTAMGGVVGFGVLGLGLACIAPQVVAAAGNSRPQGAGRNLAIVTGIGYAGMLGGPPLIGTAASLFGLANALWIIVLCTTVIAVLARAAKNVPEGHAVHAETAGHIA